jgi:hypothetical protein
MMPLILLQSFQDLKASKQIQRCDGYAKDIVDLLRYARYRWWNHAQGIG